MALKVATIRPVGVHALRGVGLVELMVTMLIGALITAGVIALFNANRQSFRLQDNLSVAQESGSFSLDFLAADLRLAGYPGGAIAVGGFDVLNSIDNRVQNMTEIINGVGTNVAFTDDQLATVHTADTRVGSRTCNGVDVNPGNLPNIYISNVYWVQTTGTVRELVCQGFLLTVPDPTGGGLITARVAQGTPQALVSGVDSFQVLYGIDTTHDVDASAPGACLDSADLVTEWVTAAQLNAALTLGANPPGGSGCGAMDARTVVRAVRIGLLMRTAADVDALPVPGQQYTVLSQTYNQANFPPIVDGRVRRLFMTTVALRNAKGSSEL